MQVIDETQHALGDAQIAGIADQRNRLEGMGHKRMLVA
jgi:hypothetical protein